MTRPAVTCTIGGLAAVYSGLYTARQAALLGWMEGDAGALEAALGVMVLALWPWSALWVIGLLVGIRMVFAGTSMLAPGLAPRGAMGPV